MSRARWLALVGPYVVVGAVLLAAVGPQVHAACTGVCAVADAVQIFLWVRVAAVICLLSAAVEISLLGGLLPFGTGGRGA